MRRSHRADLVAVSGARCKLYRRHHGTSIVARVGPEVSLPDVFTRLAIGLGCDLNITRRQTKGVALCVMGGLGGLEGQR